MLNVCFVNRVYHYYNPIAMVLYCIENKVSLVHVGRKGMCIKQVLQTRFHE